MDENSLELLKYLFWILLLVIIIFVFKKPISEFIEKLTKAEVKVNENGISVTAEAVGFITRSFIEKGFVINATDKSRYIEDGATGISDTVMKIYNNLNKIRYNNILWVDDHPEWNHNEKLAFETMGIKITWSMNNIDALNKIETENFNLVISDLFSDDGQPKGFDLLKEIKIRNVKVPLIFYTGRVTHDVKEKAKNYGAYGIVDSPASLTSRVLTALV